MNREHQIYKQGFRDGVATYAHWKDGTQFVGTTGKTLREALANIDSSWNYSPELAIKAVTSMENQAHAEQVSTSP